MSDSQLTIYLLNSVYTIKSSAMFELADRVFELINRLGCRVDFKWSRLSENKFADALASKTTSMPVTRIINHYTKLDEWKPDLYFTPDERELKKLPPLNLSCEWDVERLVILGDKTKLKDLSALRPAELMSTAKPIYKPSKNL